MPISSSSPLDHVGADACLWPAAMREPGSGGPSATNVKRRPRVVRDILRQEWRKRTIVALGQVRRLFWGARGGESLQSTHPLGLFFGPQGSPSHSPSPYRAEFGLDMGRGMDGVWAVRCVLLGRKDGAECRLT